MKKMTFKSRLFGGFVGVAAALFAVSCAQGFDDNETWRSDVTGAQLESPALTEANFSTRVNADGSESVQVSWDVVPGAGGYECYAAIVDDPENPVELVNQTVDGTSFSFGKLDDTKYEVRVRTLGNEKLDNTGAASATVVPYSTLVPAQLIPAGQDIVAFVEANILDQDKEQAFELEAGAAYEINAPLDFGKRLVTFRGDKVNRPTVTFGYDGVIRTSAGLKVKFINFDCESMNSKGVIECSENPDASLDAANFPGYAGAGKAYILQDPILIQECNFRQVQRCLFFTGRCAWGIEDLRDGLRRAALQRRHDFRRCRRLLHLRRDLRPQRIAIVVGRHPQPHGQEFDPLQPEGQLEKPHGPLLVEPDGPHFRLAVRLGHLRELHDFQDHERQGVRQQHPEPQ